MTTTNDDKAENTTKSDSLVAAKSGNTSNYQSMLESAPFGSCDDRRSMMKSTDRRGRRYLGRPSAMGQQGLQSSRLSMAIPTNWDAQVTAEERHGENSWKVKLLEILHSHPAQIFLMILLLLDVFILFIELFLAAEFPMCHIIERDAISCCPIGDGMEKTAATVEDHGHFRFLSESHGTEADHNLCSASGTMAAYDHAATCDPHKWPVVHQVELALFCTTITILSIFLIELLILAFILRGAFFRQGFYVLDLVIVATSLSLELFFHFAHNEILVSLVGLLIFARIWRFVRIGHGLVEVTAEYAHRDTEALFRYAQTLEEVLTEHNIDIPESSRHVAHLKHHLLMLEALNHPSSHSDNNAEKSPDSKTSNEDEKQTVRATSMFTSGEFINPVVEESREVPQGTE